MLAGMAGASSSSLCPVTSILLYKKDPITNVFSEWTDTAKVTLSSNKLLVNVRDGVFQNLKVYVTGRTTFGRDGILNVGPNGNGYIELDISVNCGRETVAVVSTAITESYQKAPGI